MVAEALAERTAIVKMGRHLQVEMAGKANILTPEGMMNQAASTAMRLFLDQVEEGKHAL